MTISSKDYIPLLLVAVDLVESAICAYHLDWARAWYWLAAGQITAATIFMRS
jgi:hypothetical protein